MSDRQDNEADGADDEVRASLPDTDLPDGDPPEAEAPWPPWDFDVLWWA